MTHKALWAILAVGTLALGACSDGGPTDPTGPETPASSLMTVKSDSTLKAPSSSRTNGYAVAW